MVNYLYDCYQVLNKVYSDGAYLKQAINSTPIEEKNKSLTVKTCYGVVERDIELSYYLKSLCPKSPKASVKLVLKISMYAIKHLEKKPYAVIDNAVSLIKKMGKTGVSGFVNAVLRKFVTQKINLPEEEIENLSIKYSYPVFAVKELIKDYGKERAESIMSVTGGESTLVFNGIDGESYLKNLGVEFTKTPFNAVYRVKNFVRNADYDKGLYTFQNIGSVAICESVGSGERLFDACSAPGGKSVYLSKKFTQVVAEELHEHRVELIKKYAERMQVKNLTVISHDACEFIPEYENSFDAVLCDVPCSGFGVAFENPDIKLNREENDLKSLTTLQLSIIENCSKYLKKGGRLVYSTCSVFAVENDGVVGKFLSNNKDFIVKENPSLLSHEKTKYGMQFLPDISGGGFFVSVMEKV